jgi:hypothetical protein
MHARDTKVGTIATGNDGKPWIVRETRAGVRRWVKVTNRDSNADRASGNAGRDARSALTFTDGTSFSDGTTLSMIVRGKGHVNVVQAKEPYEEMPFDQRHAAVVASRRPIVLKLEANRYFQRNAKIQAPVTVGKLVREVLSFFGKKLTAAEKKFLEEQNFISGWNRRIFPTYERLWASVKTYGDLRGDHYFFEGFVPSKTNPNVWKIVYGS